MYKAPTPNWLVFFKKPNHQQISTIVIKCSRTLTIDHWPLTSQCQCHLFAKYLLRTEGRLCCRGAGWQWTLIRLAIVMFCYVMLCRNSNNNLPSTNYLYRDAHKIYLLVNQTNNISHNNTGQHIIKNICPVKVHSLINVADLISQKRSFFLPLLSNIGLMLAWWQQTLGR